MPIDLRLARSAREIDDALWVRHEVLVIDDGKFGGKPLPAERIVDRFDAFPDTHNIIAYDGEDPVATMRVIRESPAGLPAFELFDFGDYRRRVAGKPASAPPPRFCSAGMLAVRAPWRSRRDVIRALFRTAAKFSEDLDATHIALTVNHETAGMYRRLGFERLADKVWAEEIGNHITPLVNTVEDFRERAFADLPAGHQSPFTDNYDRLVARSGEEIFREGSDGDRAYVIDSGNVRICRRKPNGDPVTVTHLTQGDLFGELALIDDSPRSASALAVSDVELRVLDRTSFNEQLRNDPACMHELFQIFAARTRSTDELEMMLGFAGEEERVRFALRMARKWARQDRKDPTRRIFAGGAEELAAFVAIDTAVAQDYLNRLAAEQGLELHGEKIIFR